MPVMGSGMALNLLGGQSPSSRPTHLTPACAVNETSSIASNGMTYVFQPLNLTLMTNIDPSEGTFLNDPFTAWLSNLEPVAMR